MGKHRNYSLNRQYFQDMYRDAKEDVRAVNTKYNTLQRKHNELKKTHKKLTELCGNLRKKVDIQRKIIEELEEALARYQTD